MNGLRYHLLAFASLSLGLTAVTTTTPAQAGSGTYQKVNQSDWWAGITGFPSYVNMYIYVPTTVATKPPIVVYTHHCQGSASSSHSSMGGLESIADKNGFIILYPEATGRNCWDAGSESSLNHNGKGDAPAVIQMVKYTLSKYSGDAGRVYAAGDSSGGIMTEALLGVFPDVFMAGVSIMGVPCGCWADGYGKGGTEEWSNGCAGGTVTKTGQAWGDLVRSYFPGYTGHRPRLQHWHGATDSTLNFKNVAEDIKEWTNLLGLSETPTTTEQDKPKSGTTHQAWKNSCYTVYETFVLANTGHAVSVDGATLAAYFGIDKAGGQDPETAACPGAVPGGSGGGATDAGPGSGAGGAIGATDGGGASSGKGGGAGAPVATGSGGASGTGSNHTGGNPGKGGVGGTSAAGLGGGGPTGSGGSSNGGVSGSNGSSGSGSPSAKGGSNGGTAGSRDNGGSSAPSGSSAGTASGESGSAATGNSAPEQGSSSGCSMGLGREAAGGKAAMLLLGLLGLVARRNRRRGH